MIYFTCMYILYITVNHLKARSLKHKDKGTIGLNDQLTKAATRRNCLDDAAPKSDFVPCLLSNKIQDCLGFVGAFIST